MRQKLYSILFLPVLALIPLPLWAAPLHAANLQSVVPGLTDAEAQTLAKTGKVTRFLEAKDHPRLVPTSSLTSNVERAFKTVHQTIGVEALFIMKPGSGPHEQRMLRWYNVLRSISTMKGIKYYSDTHGRVRVLFRDAYVIDNPRDRKRLPDQLVSSIPANSSLTILQDDSTFGKAIFHLHYHGGQDAISMSMVNLNTFFLWFLPVIGRQHMILQLVLMPYEGQLLFYGGVEVKTMSLFGLQNATRHSFVNRIEALHTWFQTVEESR